MIKLNLDNKHYFKMENNKEKKFKTPFDIPREHNHVASTHSDTTISLGKKERDLLRYLFIHKSKRFNVRDYSRSIAKIPRSTVYSCLDKLEKLELVNRSLGDNKISEKGLILIDSQESSIGNEPVGASRSECREINKLSTHFHKFKAIITERKNFSKLRLERLNPKGIKENNLHNLKQTIVYFEDATIVINPKQLIINLYDVITDNVEDSDIKCLSRAIEYSKKLMSVGIETEGILVEEGHWARIQSFLSDFLYEKVDNKYFLDLGDGKMFYIDHSPDKFGVPKREDETNDKIVRERVDSFLNQISSNDFDLHDIDKIKESLGFITKLESARLTDQIEENKLKRLQLEKKEISENKFEGYTGYLG